jgi:hypothetical protein
MQALCCWLLCSGSLKTQGVELAPPLDLGATVGASRDTMRPHPGRKQSVQQRTWMRGGDSGGCKDRATVRFVAVLSDTLDMLCIGQGSAINTVSNAGEPGHSGRGMGVARSMEHVCTIRALPSLAQTSTKHAVIR